jgi:hypothetical protein
MHKSADVSVRLTIDGEDEPAHDYAALVTEIARRVVELGVAAYQKEGPFRVQLDTVKVLEGSAGEEEEVSP